MKRPISLLTMGAGNVIVLEETLKSFSTVCDEIIYGDLLLFPEDREIVHMYAKKYNLKIIGFEFDYIFKHGFASVLNALAHHAKNNMCLYANTSEVIEKDFGITEKVEGNPDCNMFYFTHATDPHRWFRCYDKRYLRWSGLIHESVVGDERPYHKSIFEMADMEKDMGNPFKAKILDITKEIVYFTQYNKIVDHPELLGGTDPGWVHFATANYESMAYRLRQKGRLYEAFKNGDMNEFLSIVYSNEDLQKQTFESNAGIEYQNDKKYLL